MDKAKKDLFFMQYALQLAEKGRVMAPPNPWVGCVIVNQDNIVGQGYHAQAGQAHAEIMALKQAGKAAKGSSVYVTLEPCAHHGKTPPCVDALIQAQVKEVIIPFLDPDPQVASRGKCLLEKAGITVICGVAESEARYFLAPYLHHRQTKTSYVALKVAMSLDGKAAAVDETSKWITGRSSRDSVHALRAASQAILVGSHTALVDNPCLTVRLDSYAMCKPLRVVFDTQGRLPLDCALFDTTLAPTLIVSRGPYPRLKQMEETGIEVLELPSTDPLKALVKHLGQKGVLQLLVEGGPKLQMQFLQANLAQKYYVYLSGCLLGEQAVDAFPVLSVNTIAEAKRWQLHSLCRYDQDICLEYMIS